MNHEPLNTGSRDRYELTFGKAVLMSSPVGRSQMCAGANHQDAADRIVDVLLEKLQSKQWGAP